MKKVVDLVVENAERTSQAARARMIATAMTLRSRLAPRSLIADGASAAVGRASQMVDTVTEAVKSRPVASGAGGAAVLAAFGLRFWLKRRKSANGDETSAPPEG